MPRDTAVHSRGRGKRAYKGTTRQTPKPAPQQDFSPAGQLRRGGALDKQGRQKVLVKAKPRPKAERGRIYVDSGGKTRVLPQKVYNRRVRAQARANVKRQAFEKQTKKPTALRAIQPGNTGTTRILGVNVEKELRKIGEVGHSVGRAVVRADQLNRRSTGQASFNPIPAKVQDAFTQDVFDFPANIPASTYGLGSALRQKQQGKPEALNEIVHQAKEHDPGVLLLRRKFKRAGQEALKHPLLAGLEASGVTRGASIGAGQVARSGVLGPGLRRAASLKGEDRVVPGTAMNEKRYYSKGAVGKARQVSKDKKRRAKANNLYQQAQRAADDAYRSGNHEGFGRADELQQKAINADPRLAHTSSKRPPKHRVLRRPVPPRNVIHERIDQRQALAESRRRGNRSQVVKAVGEVTPGQQLVSQGIVAPTRESFLRYHDRLMEQYRHGGLSDDEKRANAQTRDVIQKELKDFDPVALSEGAQRYADVVRPLQRELVRRGIVAPEQARMAKLVPYAREHMGATYNHKEGRLELDGQPLPVEAIERHIAADQGDGTPVMHPENVAFQTHAPNQRGGQNFFIAPGPKGIKSGARTGEATVKGRFDLDTEVPRENVARMQGLIDAHNEYAEFVKEASLRGEDGEVARFASKKAADEALAEMKAQRYGENNPASQEWVAIPTRPQFGKRSQSEALLDQADNDVPLATKDIIDDALQGNGDGQYVLAHADAVKRQREHLNALNASVGQKALRAATAQFRGVVLTTSPTWPTGNILEGLGRAGVAQVKPWHVKFVRDVEKRVRELDPKMADELRHRVGEGHFGVQEIQRIHTAASKFDGTVLEPLAHSLARLRHAPVAKQAADLWVKYTHAVFGANGMIEQQIKMGMAGKYMADFLPDKHILQDWGTAVEQAARGMVNTAEQVRAARWLDDAYGKYGGFSPSTRNTISQYTPFLAWTINAFKFITTVLPRDHPVLTGLFASNHIAMQKWRQDIGLGVGDGALPYWMKGVLPIADTWRDLTRYTPFGAFRSPLDAIGSTILPQLSGIIAAGRGVDWKNDSLIKDVDPDKVDEATKIKAAAGALFGGMIPILGQVKRGAEHPGSLIDKAGHVLNPVKPIQRQPAQLAVTFDKLARNQRTLEALRHTLRNGKPVNADNPTKEYTRLLAEQRQLEKDKYRLSKGKYGTKPAGSGNKSLLNRAGPSTGGTSLLDRQSPSTSGKSLLDR